MVEQELLQDTHHFDETVFLLLAVHYVFDLQYNAAVFDTLLFIQEFVMTVRANTVCFILVSVPGFTGQVKNEVMDNIYQHLSTFITW